jgi:AraC-like DNA-binding protein
LTRSDSTPADAAHTEVHAQQEVRGMLSALEGLGFDLDALLAAAGLRRRDVVDPDAYLSPAACATVFLRAQQERRVKNLALHVAGRTPIGANPLLDYLIVCSDSVGQGIERLCRYLRLVNAGVRMGVLDEDDPVRVAIEAGSAFETELSVSLSVLRFRQEAEGPFAAAFASFAHDPDDAEEYRHVLGCPVRTRASWSGWALTKAMMARPLRRRDPALRQWLDRQAAGLLARLPSTGTVEDDVTRVLSAQMTAGEVELEVVARRLATTPRTLQRRLARAGTSFESLRDGARREAAAAYLADTALSIGEIGYLLGYSEPAAFHRAFKRWHGTTPQAFRAGRRAARRAPENPE